MTKNQRKLETDKNHMKMGTALLIIKAKTLS